ncbi:MAG: HAD family phosphatase [Legionella sp.]|uniref:HAD family hydrolase n=1 Tax=Legionella sp. TaxID=459 RepID=UPI0028412A28|nr:HAD family phosphatase [Legionella sp.]
MESKLGYTPGKLLAAAGLYKKPGCAIKNIIFDIGGVVLNFDPIKVITQIFPDSDINYILMNTYRSNNWSAFDKGDISEEELVSSIAESITCEKEKVVQFIELTKKSWFPNLDTIKLIEDLHDNGIKLYALTNMPASIQLYLRQNFTFWQYFEEIVVSSDVHMAKPEIDIYSYFIKQSGINPAESVFIDDRLENLTCAQDLGLNTIHFDQLERCKQKLIDDFRLVLNPMPNLPSQGIAKTFTAEGIGFK